MIVHGLVLGLYQANCLKKKEEEKRDNLNIRQGKGQKKFMLEE